MNIHVPVFAWTYVFIFLEYTSRSRIAIPDGDSMFNLLRINKNQIAMGYFFSKKMLGTENKKRSRLGLKGAIDNPLSNSYKRVGRFSIFINYFCMACLRST